MANMTVDEMMKSICFYTNGDLNVPLANEDEYKIWLQALNDAQRDWEQVDYDWQTLYSVSTVSVGVSTTTLPLPTDFRKLAGWVSIFDREYQEIKKHEEPYYSSAEKYVVIDYATKVMRINPALSSPASVRIPYYKTPPPLINGTDKSLCPSDQYLIYNAVGKILLSRDNQKYAEYITQANMLLQQMIGKEVVTSTFSDNTTKNDLFTLYGFTPGVD